ncbi:MAG: arylsulfatase, partial [Candidatus Micropelagos sp.]
MKRPKPLFFASNSPEYNSFSLAMIDGDDKLVQIIDHNNRSTEITNHLFDLSEDPYEKNNLAEKNP